MSIPNARKSRRIATAAIAIAESCASEPTTPNGHLGAPDDSFGNSVCAHPSRANNWRATMRAAPLARRTFVTLPSNAFASSRMSAYSSPGKIGRWPINSPATDKASIAGRRLQLALIASRIGQRLKPQYVQPRRGGISGHVAGKLKLLLKRDQLGPTIAIMLNLS
jgi:hypothetical protein